METTYQLGDVVLHRGILYFVASYKRKSVESLVTRDLPESLLLEIHNVATNRHMTVPPDSNLLSPYREEDEHPEEIRALARMTKEYVHYLKLKKYGEESK